MQFHLATVKDFITKKSRLIKRLSGRNETKTKGQKEMYSFMLLFIEVKRQKSLQSEPKRTERASTTQHGVLISSLFLNKMNNQKCGLITNKNSTLGQLYGHILLF